MRSSGSVTPTCGDSHRSALLAAGRVAGEGRAPPCPPSDAVCAWGAQRTGHVPGRELPPVPWVLMDSVQPPGQSCPEDVRALCVSPTSSCSCCMQIPGSPHAPRLHRGHHPARSWGSAAPLPAAQEQSYQRWLARAALVPVPEPSLVPVPCSPGVDPPAQLCPGHLQSWTFHRAKPAPYPTGLILLQQAEAGGIGVERGDKHETLPWWGST